MSRFNLLILGVVVVLCGVFVIGAGYVSAPSVPPQGGVSSSYSNAAYGISFSYPEGYVLTETDAAGSAQRAHHVITLMRSGDLPPPEAGEGPPSITIDIYQNDRDALSAEAWIRNDSRSNFKLGDGRLASTTISGIPALSYRWSGLYEGTTIALAQPRWIYALSVTYLEMGADIVQDFVAVRDSVRIVQ